MPQNSPVALLGHDVYAVVAGVSFARPLIPHPDTGEPLGVDGIEFEVTTDEPLEAVAEIAVGRRSFAKMREHVMDRNFRHADRWNSLCGQQPKLREMSF